MSAQIGYNVAERGGISVLPQSKSRVPRDITGSLQINIELS